MISSLRNRVVQNASKCIAQTACNIQGTPTVLAYHRPSSYQDAFGRSLPDRSCARGLVGSLCSSRRSFMSEGGAGTGEGNHKAPEQENASGTPGEEKAAGAAEDEQGKLVEKLMAENKELKDKVLYTLAEMENVRTIARRDAASAKQFALQSFAKQLLDVADNLNRALASVPKEALEEGGEAGGKEGGGSSLLATLVEGVAMTDAQLQKVFAANQIVQYGKPGDKFDPHMHDALFEYDEEGREGGSVGQVLKTGYTLNGRVIRPAQVGTVKKAV
ncbi:hypothetical protein NSK_006714 [Nannochloropsis salina CCMP1776]|uniref:GrpE protein homolog n=1 Tax=Nannochloropsis salina CCMP1776 TaxID=1027361 RepID=A0A4D9D094_9STRA|nr:hypothetical protein NSK_006714 [Nannochloropsis salina CCMP1776]|eukprot:TFJ82048.1 hypothetical protein NSK_006714 [Nannochloropsis salina CCMP1776]